MSLISPNFDVKLIIFPYFNQGPFPKIAGKSLALHLDVYLEISLMNLNDLNISSFAIWFFALS